MAETVHLFLKANGKDIAGESTQTSLDREGSIECVSFEHGVLTAREAGTGLAVGRRQYAPIRVRKRIDASSPLLLKALVENQCIDGTFKFYRPDPTGDGQTQQFYSVEITGGRIESVQQRSDDATSPAQSRLPPMEEVTFVFHTVSWTFEPSGVTHEDSWSENR